MDNLESLLLVVIFSIIIAGFTAVLFQPRVLAKFAPAGTPRILGLIRIIVVSVALLYVLDTEFLRTAIFIGPGYAADFYTPVGILTPLLQASWFLPLLSKSSFLLAIKTLTIVFLGAALIGYRTRLALVTGLFLYILYSGILLQSLLLSHYGVQVTLLLAVLALLPAGEAYALDAKKPATTIDAPTAQHTLGVYIILIALCVPYFFAVINKLLHMGAAWFSVSNIRGDLHAGLYLDSSSRLWDLTLLSTHLPDWVFLIAGISIILLQASYFLVLFSHYARLILPAGIILMHTSIYIFMGFWFIDLILLQLIVYVIVYYSRQRTLQTAVYAGKQSLLYWYGAIVVLLLLAPTICTIYQSKFHPFSGWSVYATASGYHSRGFFSYGNLRFTLADGSEELISLDTFQREVGLYSYPRQGCFWDDELRHLYDSCNTFFNRSAAILNDTHYQTNPIMQISFERRRWTLATLQNRPDDLFTLHPAYRTDFIIEPASRSE